MKIKLRTLIIAWVVILLSMLWIIKATAITPKLTGGTSYTKSMSIWELHKYKTVTLMRKSPMQWCPFRAYLTVDAHVHVGVRGNRYYLAVDTNICKLLNTDATYNLKYARAFKTSGTRKQQVKQIYTYCKKTKYTAHIKTAKEVFGTRRGDCAGIAAAFYVLCKAKGIPVRYVIGWTDGGCHAWNRVCISGKWYWIDCTYGLWLSKKQYPGRSVMEIW